MAREMADDVAQALIQQPTLKPYELSLREQIAAGIAGVLPSWLAPDQYEAQQLGDKFATLAEFSPLGILTAGDDYGRAKETGNLPAMGMAALAAVPMVGAEARAAEKAGIRAFHGSPHSFDKFSLDKIGTGEGAQAYGHGLYFAENEDVARSYRDALSNTLARDGSRVSHGDADYAIMEAGHNVGGVGQRQLDTLSTNIVEAIRNGDDPTQVIAALAKSDQERAAGQAMLETAKQYHQGPPGSMYEVNIAADPNHFLDWDAPISEQPHIQEALPKMGFTPAPFPYSGWMGDKLIGKNDYPETLLRALGEKGVGEAKLNQVGIPGIKYMDAGSRGAAEGTRNYVVFDDALVNIVRKYGLAGAIGAGLISAEMGQQMQDQGLL